MEALAERLYRRWPERSVAITEWLAVLIVLVLIGPAGLPAFTRLLGLGVGDAFVLCTVVAAVTAAGSALAMASTRRQVAPLKAWVRGDHGDPAAAWTAAQALPLVTSSRAVMIGLPLNVVVAELVLGRLGEVTAGQRLSLATLLAGAAVAGWVIVVFGFELTYRPVLRECSEAMTDVTLPAGAWGLRRKMLIGLGGLGVSIGLLTVTVTAPDTANGSLAPAAAIGAIGATAYAVTLYSGLVASPILRPVRDLIEATRRVEGGDYLTSVPLTSADELGELAVSFNAMQRGLRERESLHAAFGTFVDPALTAKLLELGDEAFAGELVAVSVLFVDVRGFTTYASTVEPDEAVALLNRLFGVVVPIVRRHQGHPNHFLGDGLLAIFGAPEPVGDHADQAVAAAREMQHAVYAEFGESLRIGVGVNSGKVIAGTIGGGGKLEYTVIGDAVNLAARVEQLTKTTGDSILVTEATGALLSDHRDLVDKGLHEVRGKAEPVRLFGVRC